MAEEQTIVEKQVDCLALFEPIQAQMALAKEENDNLVFDYEDPQGNKDARSHIQKLRHVKTEIANVHKTAKAEALAVCRKIDGFKNKLTGEVDAMIAVHNEPIQRIQRAREEAEAEELRKIQEAKERAEAERIAALERREAAVREAEEKAAAEKAKKLAEAERVEREKQIAEQAKLQAEQEAKRKLEEAERKRLADIAAVEAKAKAEAEAKEQAQRQQREEENRRLVAEQEAEQRRVANIKHRTKIHDAIEARLTELGLDMHDAANVLGALKTGTIPHVTIQY
jgi:hypothetical protein